MQAIFSYIPTLLQGLPISLLLSVAALFFAFILAIVFTIFLTLKIKLLAPLTRIYITIFTGTPLLIQIFIIYYGPGQFEFIRDQFPAIWQVISQPWLCATLALTLNSAAYTTLLFQGAVKAIPQGQWQSCQALGFSKLQTLRILLPYAVKRSLSAYSNEVILVFKSTSLTSTITLMDIMGYAQLEQVRTYDISVFVTAGIIYLAVNGLLTLLLRLIEHKTLVFERH